MQVKDFIITFGIEKLEGQKIEENGKIYKIVLSEFDLEFHSINDPNWQGSQERLDRYHQNGKYRFYAADKTEMCVWVYPRTELYVENRTKNFSIK